MKFGEIEVSKFDIARFDFHEIYMRMRPLIVDRFLFGRQHIDMMSVPDVLRFALEVSFQGLCWFEHLDNCKHLVKDPEDRKQWLALEEEIKRIKPYFVDKIASIWREWEESVRLITFLILTVALGVLMLVVFLVALIIAEKVLTIRKRLWEERERAEISRNFTSRSKQKFKSSNFKRLSGSNSLNCTTALKAESIVVESSSDNDSVESDAGEFETPNLSDLQRKNRRAHSLPDMSRMYLGSPGP